MIFNKGFHYRVDEIVVQDKFPKQFRVFLDKYKQMNTDDLYVNFTNYSGDILSKGAYVPANPTSHTHEDPVGVYAYFMDYVIDYPMDIKYGAEFKYLRVIKSKAKNTLKLQDVTEQQAFHLIKKLYNFSQSELEVWRGIVKDDDIHRAYLTKRGFSWGKFLWNMVTSSKLARLPFEEGITKRWLIHKASRAFVDKDTHIQQTKSFLSLGFDAILDNADNPAESIIYESEPSQIVFLTRSAFEVTEVFDLVERRQEGLEPLVKKLMERIARQVLKEKLPTFSGLDTLGDADYIAQEFTNKNSLISIGVKRPRETMMRDTHKIYTNKDLTVLLISVVCDRGEFNIKANPEDSFNEIINFLDNKVKKIVVNPESQTLDMENMIKVKIKVRTKMLDRMKN